MWKNLNKLFAQLGWVFAVALSLSLVVTSGGCSLVVVVLGLLILGASLAVQHEL